MGGDLLSGLVQGFAATAQQQQQRQVQEEHKKALIEQSKLQTKMLENKLTLAQTEQAMQEKWFNLVSGLAGGGQPGMPGPQGPPQAAIPTPAPQLGGYDKMSSSMGEYGDLINQAAAAHGIDPNFLASIIQRESGFNPKAVSPAGAQGIAQFMPGTAAAMGVQNPFDPTQAIPGAAKYLKQHLDEFGSYPLAAAAYNAGEGAVRKHGGIPPYAETQKFVSNVMGGLPQQIAAQQMPMPANPVTAMSPNQRFVMDIMTKKYGGIDPKFRERGQVHRIVDLGDRIRYIDEQGNALQEVRKTTKPEAVDIEEPGGGKKRFFYDPYNPGQGMPLQPGGLKPEQAGKVNLAGNAQKRLQEVTGMVLPGGKLNRTLLAKAAMPLGGIGEGAQLHSKMYQAIDAALRLETGAQATPHEIQTKMQEFWPSVKDTEDTIKIKLKDFNEYVTGVVQLVDPTGELRKARGNPSLDAFKNKGPKTADEYLRMMK